MFPLAGGREEGRYRSEVGRENTSREKTSTLQEAS